MTRRLEMSAVARDWSRRIVCWLLAASMGGLAQPAPAAPGDDYDVAVALYQKERWEDAAASFGRFIEANPEHEQVDSALLYSGFALVNAGSYGQAREMFQRFVTEFPESERMADALYRLGETSYSLGDYERAAKDFSAFLEKYPEHQLREWALPYLGDAELRLKKFPEAATHFRAAIKEFPDGPLTSEAEFGLARSLEAQGQSEEALAAFKAIAEGDGPRAAASQMRVATILYDTQQYAEASGQFRELTRRFPQSQFVPTAQLNAGFSAYRADDFTAAVAALEQAATTAANAPSAYYWMGMAHKEAGNADKAAQAFQTVVTDYPQSEFAGESRFQWADSALRSGQTEQALKLYEEIASQDPPSDHAAAAVYFAGEAAMMLGDLERAGALVERFEKQHADSAYRMHGRLLAGRVLETRASGQNVSDAEQTALEEQALAKYQSVLEQTEVESTAAKARFQSARLRERRGEHEQSLEVLEPLLSSISELGAESPHLDALILAARDHLALEQFDKAIQAATTYLELAPAGPRAIEALSARAAAHVAAKQEAPAKADWEQLEQQAGNETSELLPIARELAEKAYATEQWSLAADFFKEVVELAGDQPEGALGLSGLGWSLHKAGKNQDASRAFGELLTRYPTAPRLAPEAAYMKGKTLQDAGDLAAAATAYRTAFETFAPEQPAAPGAEASGTERNVYLSGLQLARVLRLQQETEKADAAYAALVEAFPRPANLDNLLEEWALLHYEAGDYARADELFQRILTETPESPRAASARLSLAESAMVKGDFEAAAAAAEAIIANDAAPVETRQRARTMRIRLAAEQGDWDRVIELATQYLEQSPQGLDRPIVMYLQGEALLQTGQGEAAEALLTQVVELGGQSDVQAEPWFPRVKLLLAELSLQEKDYDAALTLLDEFQAIEPPPGYAYTAHELRGRLLKQRAKFEEARQAYQQVLHDETARRTETAARAQYGIAETYFLQQDWEKARTEALRVYTLYKFPEWQAPALLMIGLTDEMMGEPQKAAKSYNALLTEFPESSAAEKAREKLKSLSTSVGSQ